MLRVCLYFQVHQPYRLNRDFAFFDIGRQTPYFDEALNRTIMERVARRCYLPTNRLIKRLIEETDQQFAVAFSVTGTCLEQMKDYAPRALQSFKELARSSRVEFLSETYFHSLASVMSWSEFDCQVSQHRKAMLNEFGQTPKVFRNTELIADKPLALHIERLGFSGLITEGAHQILGWRSPNHLYMPDGCYKLKLLLKNFQLSDDIAFRFSDRAWPGFPLEANTYARWVHTLKGQADTLNLFMDYETFGEHHWPETGIFEFLKALPNAILADPDVTFSTPSEVLAALQPVAKIDIPFPISWADVERDLTAWLGNPLQDSAIEELYSMEQRVLAKGDPQLLATWRKLQTSDHFYYMCTKWFSDGDVHKYFNPYQSPHHAWVAYCHILADLDQRL